LTVQISPKTRMPALLFFITVFCLSLLNPVLAADDDEETYNISLVQTAEVDKEIVTVDDKKVLTETYTAKNGDYVWNILRERKLLEKNNLGEILSVLKRLNPSLTNIDLIHPGDNIIIPLVVTPAGGDRALLEADLESIPLEDIENLEFYTVQPGGGPRDGLCWQTSLSESCDPYYGDSGVEVLGTLESCCWACNVTIQRVRTTVTE